MWSKDVTQRERAWKAASDHPDSATVTRCADWGATLDAYLDAQMEPGQRRGRELMDGLIPAHLHDRVCQRLH